jgi:anti-sigma B factor antagonist
MVSSPDPLVYSPTPARRRPISQSAVHPDLMRFRSDVLPAGDRRVVVRPVGELDIATVPEVDAQLARARADGFTELVLDLRELGFMDSSGLRLILEWTELAGRDGCTFKVVEGPEPVQRVLRLTRVVDALRFEPPG